MQNQNTQFPKVVYIEPKVFLKLKDKKNYNPELKVIHSEKISITLNNCDGIPYSKDIIIQGENTYIKTKKVVKSNYCTMRTIEVEPWHSDQPAVFGRIYEVVGGGQKTVTLQVFLYYGNKWYVFTYLK